MPYHPESLTGPSQAKTSASTNTEAPWEPVHWRPAYTEMVKMQTAGIPYSRIVYHFKRFGVSYSNRHIRRIVESGKGRELAALISAQSTGGVDGLQKALGEYLPEAIGVELDIMRNPFSGERHRVASAQDLLDRGGLPKISRQEGNNQLPTTIILNLLPSQLSQFLLPPPAIEAEFVELPPVRDSTSADD